MESAGTWAPWFFLGLFVAASCLMIWRLEAMTESGVEGTVLGSSSCPTARHGQLDLRLCLGAKAVRAGKC